MIKRTLVEIRDISDREQKQHQPNGTPDTPSGNFISNLLYNRLIVDQRLQKKMSRKDRALKLQQDKEKEKKEAQKTKNNKKQKLV